MYSKPARVQENKVVMAKLPREDFVLFQNYCELKGETPNAAIRRIIMAEVEKPTKENLSGKTEFFYNQTKDTFTWKIILDDGTKINVAEDLSPAFVEQFSEQLHKAKAERESYLGKKNKDSVPVPRKLARMKK